MLLESFTDAISIIIKCIQVLRNKSYEQMHNWAQLDTTFQIKPKLMETTTNNNIQERNIHIE